MAAAERVLSIARRELGTKESPANSNRVKYNAWYYGREVSGSAYPWCMAFVQWVFAQMKVSLPLRTASCSALMWKAQERGMWVEKDFRPGDIVIYDFTGKRKTASHCGIVEEVLPDYGVRAVEGNTSAAGSQSNGGMVCRKDRHSKYIMGAVRPAFEEEEDDMNINKLLSEMTDEQAYTLLEKAQRHAAKLPEQEWSAKEGHWQAATDAGVVNGTAPEGLVKRCELTAVLGRKGLI